MLDERWPADVARTAGELRRLLADCCTVAVVRGAVVGEVSGGEAVAQRLGDFGLGQLPPDPVLLAAVWAELGRVLAPIGLAADGPVVLAGEWWRSGEPSDIEVAETRRRVLCEVGRIVGGLRRLQELAVTYAGERRQFGQSIGSFQAVAHRLADVAVAVDGLDLLLRKAVWAAHHDNGGDGVPGIAMSYCLISATTTRVDPVCRSAHQVMGGFGFSTEADTGLFTERLAGWSRALPMSGRDARRALGTVVREGGPGSGERLWGVEPTAADGLPLPRWARELDGART